jgi:hypothetical protein
MSIPTPGTANPRGRNEHPDPRHGQSQGWERACRPSARPFPGDWDAAASARPSRRSPDCICPEVGVIAAAGEDNVALPESRRPWRPSGRRRPQPWNSRGGMRPAEEQAPVPDPREDAVASGRTPESRLIRRVVANWNPARACCAGCTPKASSLWSVREGFSTRRCSDCFRAPAKHGSHGNRSSRC